MLVVLFVALTWIVLWLLTALHECACAAVACRLGIDVKAVSIGMGTRLLVWRRGPTEWRLRALPLGGYTEFREAPVEVRNGVEYRERVAGTLEAASVWRQAAVVLTRPVSILLVGIPLIGIPVWCGTPQLVRRSWSPQETLRVRTPLLTQREQRSTWKGQFEFMEDTAGVYFARVATFQSLRGWGGPGTFLVTASRTGPVSVPHWLTLIGISALSMALLDLIPLGGSPGFLLISIGAGFVGRTRSRRHTRVVACIYYLSLLLLLVWVTRALSLDFRWFWDVFSQRP